MSTDDASSRLSNALEAIFSKAAPTADWSVDDEPASSSDEAIEGPRATAERETEETGATAASVGPAARAAQPPAANGDPRALPTAPDESTEPDEVFVLPEIVPATLEPEPMAAVPPPPVAPVLPPTTTRAVPVVAPPAPAPAPAPAAPAKQPATSWADHMTSAAPTSAPGAALRAPGRRPRVRRVTRVLRHIDPWSTFKVGLLFSAVAYVVVLTAGVLLWQVADSTGTLENVERWFTQFGWETFELKGGEIFHNAWIIGLFGVVAVTGGLVLLATLFNLVSDIVGGVRVTVLEEEVVERTISSTRRYVVRRPPLGSDATGEGPAWDVDDEPSDGNGKGSSDRPSAPAPAGGSGDWSVDDDDDSDEPRTGPV